MIDVLDCEVEFILLPLWVAAFELAMAPRSQSWLFPAPRVGLRSALGPPGRSWLPERVNPRWCGSEGLRPHNRMPGIQSHRIARGYGRSDDGSSDSLRSKASSTSFASERRRKRWAMARDFDHSPSSGRGRPRALWLDQVRNARMALTTR